MSLLRSSEDQLKAEARQCVQLAKSAVHAFVARPSKGVGAFRSVVLVKTQNSRRYIQGIKCWNDDHELRAAAFAQLINEAARSRHTS